MEIDAEIVRVARLFALIFDLTTLDGWEGGNGEPIETFAQQLANALGEKLIPSGLPLAIGNYDGTDYNVVLLYQDSETTNWFAFCPDENEGWWWRGSELKLTGETT